MAKYFKNNVLVAIMNNKKDFLIAQEKGWYGIPVKSAPKNMYDETILKYLAFYQTLFVFCGIQNTNKLRSICHRTRFFLLAKLDFQVLNNFNEYIADITIEYSKRKIT